MVQFQAHNRFSIKMYFIYYFKNIFVAAKIFISSTYKYGNIDKFLLSKIFLTC